MSDLHANQHGRIDARPIPNPPTSFPDFETCSAERSLLDEYVACTSMWRSFCPHLLLYREHHICLHPDAHEIMARTAAKHRAEASPGGK